MDETVILNDTASSPPMTEVHIWIGHYADGSEGMLAHGFRYPDGTEHHMPLLNSRREVAERAGDIARQIQSASQHARARIVRVELRTFRAVMS